MDKRFLQQENQFKEMKHVLIRKTINQENSSKFHHRENGSTVAKMEEEASGFKNTDRFIQI